MPQSVFVQVGQCGNQIGYRFWDLALREYQFHDNYTEDIDNFFKVRDQSKLQSNIYEAVKARAVLVDMEEGVISEVLRSPLRHIFDSKQLVTDISGSGNNWAVGNKFYGSKYRSHIIELFRKEVEECDSLQCFFLLHSMGGGTGSGLGTAVLEYLYDEFPKIPRFVFAAFPSVQDDVVTSPYNAVLANRQLIHYADCVIPFQNKALIDVCNKAGKMKISQHCNNRLVFGTRVQGRELLLNSKSSKPFDEMNDIVADVVLNLTCSSRFPGSLNVDINEIVMNMTPYPKLHYLVPSISPLPPSYGYSNVDQAFNEVFSLNHQLFQCSLSHGTLLSSAILCRGKITMSDVQFNIERLKGTMKFAPWNADGWKVGLCSIPHILYPHSVLVLSNTTSISKPLCQLKDNFLKMYRKKAHLHHFLEVHGMESDLFKSSLIDLQALIEDYKEFEQLTETLEQPRLNILL